MERVGFATPVQPQYSTEDHAPGPPPATSAPPAPEMSGHVEQLVKDWCGSNGTEWVPDSFRGTNFADACKRHDECYGTPGANKDLCDYNLQQDMSLDCSAQGGGLMCHVVAGIYHEAVHRFGTEAYERAQKGEK